MDVRKQSNIVNISSLARCALCVCGGTTFWLTGHGCFVASSEAEVVENETLVDVCSHAAAVVGSAGALAECRARIWLEAILIGYAQTAERTPSKAARLALALDSLMRLSLEQPWELYSALGRDITDYVTGPTVLIAAAVLKLRDQSSGKVERFFLCSALAKAFASPLPEDLHGIRALAMWLHTSVNSGEY